MKLSKAPKCFKFDKLTPTPDKSDFYKDEDGWILRVSIYRNFTVSEFVNPSSKQICRPSMIVIN